MSFLLLLSKRIEEGQICSAGTKHPSPQAAFQSLWALKGGFRLEEATFSFFSFFDCHLPGPFSGQEMLVGRWKNPVQQHHVGRRVQGN